MKNKILMPVFLCISLFLTACSKNIEEQQETEVARIPVETTIATNNNIYNTLRYVGNVNAINSVSVSSAISGKVSSTFFDVGDTVTNGQILFTIDEQSIRDQIKMLESQLNMSNKSVLSAENAANNVSGGNFKSQIEQLQNAVNTANTQLEGATLSLKNAQLNLSNAKDSLSRAQTNYNNTKALFDVGSASRNDLELAENTLAQAQNTVSQSEIGVNQAQLTFEQANDTLQLANNNLNLTTGTILEENITNAQLGIEQAIASRNATQVQLDIARASLNDASVTAPISGIISSKNANTGEFISTQVSAFTIVDIDTVNISVNVSETLITKLTPGQEVNVTIQSVQNEPFIGRISSISPSTDQTNTFPVLIEIPNTNKVLKQGMFAEVSFIQDASTNTVVVSRNTVLSNGETQYVYINDNNVARRIEVTTGIDTGKEIEILTGINVGDEIITTGQSFVIDGDLINITNKSSSNTEETKTEEDTEDVITGGN